MIQATSTLIVCDFHCSLCSIFILQKCISLTIIIVCECFFVNYRFSILFSSCFLFPHPIHASLLLSSKNVYCWKNVVFFSINQAKLVKLLITCMMLYVINCVMSHILCHWLPSTSYLLVIYPICSFSKVRKKCIKFKITLIMAVINKAFVFTHSICMCFIFYTDFYIKKLLSNMTFWYILHL